MLKLRTDSIVEGASSNGKLFPNSPSCINFILVCGRKQFAFYARTIEASSSLSILYWINSCFFFKWSTLSFVLLSISFISFCPLRLLKHFKMLDASFGKTASCLALSIVTSIISCLKRLDSALIWFAYFEFIDKD